MKTEKPSFHNALEASQEAASSTPDSLNFYTDPVTEKDVSLIVSLGRWVIAVLLVVILVTVYLEGRYASSADFRIFKDDSKANVNLLRADVMAMSKVKTLTISAVVLGLREQTIMDNLFELSLRRKAKSLPKEELDDINAMEERSRKELHDILQRKLQLEAELRSLPPIYIGEGSRPPFH